MSEEVEEREFEAGVWIVLANSRRARLCRGILTPHGRCHLEEKEGIETSWEELQHGRPTPRWGKDQHTYASLGHEEEERVRHFARELARWLVRKTEEHGFDRLAVFSPPRLLGELRKAWARESKVELAFHEADLAHVPPAELATHPVIVRVVTPREEAG